MQIYEKDFNEGWNNFQSRWFYHNFKSIPLDLLKTDSLNEANSILMA